MNLGGYYNGSMRRRYLFLLAGIVLVALAAVLALTGADADQSDQTDQTYTSPTISFRYPEGFTITSFEEGEGEVILAQTGSAIFGSPTSEDGFQIFIAPFDEPGPITAERIRQDLPEMKIGNPQSSEVGLPKVGSPNIRALTFDSESAGGEPTFEIWFAFGGRLYQMTAPAGFEERLLEVARSIAIF